MKTADVVIGANYGDEGKGLTTDYLASQYKNNCVVIRYNGGAQAGHTVQTETVNDNKLTRYVFSHFGSGSLLGKRTYLAERFVVNPILFNKEYQELDGKIHIPKVYVHPNCIVTTPFDVFINQAFEISKDKDRHGSCGIGFNESITRHLSVQPKIDFKLHVYDLYNMNHTIKKLYHIREKYVYKRLTDLKINKTMPDSYIERFFSDKTIENFINDLCDFRRRIEVLHHKDVLDGYDHIIFEGAQGLLLDEDHPNFPYVTRSHPGLNNISKILAETNNNNIELNTYYVTRSYLTRHGKGPFEDEDLSVLRNYCIKDETNLVNFFQGALRFGYLNLDLLADSINKDLSKHKHLNINPKIVITCMDQADNVVIFQNNNKRCQDSNILFPDTVLRKLNFKKALVSYGPTRKTIRKYDSGL